MKIVLNTMNRDRYCEDKLVDETKHLKIWR